MSSAPLFRPSLSLIGGALLWALAACAEGAAPPADTRLADALRPAMELVAEGSFDQAFALADDYAEVPGALDYQAEFMRGYARHKAKRYAAAREHFERAVSLAPDYHPTWHFLGFACHALGDLDRAEQAFAEHARQVPGEGSPGGPGADDQDTVAPGAGVGPGAAQGRVNSRGSGGLRSAASAERFAFVDVAEPAGLALHVTSGRTPATQIVEVKGGGVALIDRDADGDWDLFVPNGATLDSPERGPGCRFGVPRTARSSPLRVEVRWPDGWSQALADVLPGELLVERRSPCPSSSQPAARRAPLAPSAIHPTSWATLAAGHRPQP